MHFASSFLSTDTLVSAGVVVLALILFAECGILLGFFLPGDTVLFSAGVLSANGKAGGNLALWLTVLPLAAIAGNLVGYWIGYKGGPAVFNRPRSRIFRPEFVERTQAFFDRFGRPTVFVARFVPIVRTVATVMAGVGRMRFGIYVLWSVLGAVAWADGMYLLGYWLGHNSFVQKNIQPHLDLIIVGAVLLGILPMTFHLLRSRRQRGDRPAAQEAGRR